MTQNKNEPSKPNTQQMTQHLNKNDKVSLSPLSAEKLGSVFELIVSLRDAISLLEVKRKLQLSALLFLQFLSGLTEIVSLGALLPFLSALSNTTAFFNRPEIQPAIKFLGIENESELVIYASAIFVLAFVFVNCLKVFTFWAQTQISVVIGGDLNRRFFKRVLHQDFEYHLNTNSGTIISRNFTDLSAVMQFIWSAMTFSTHSITIVAILSAVLYYDFVATIIIFASTLIIYFIVANINKGQMIKNGIIISDSRASSTHHLQAGLGGIRNVLLDNRQKEFVRRYSKADMAFRRASAKTQILSVLPRYILEVVSVTILVTIAAYYSVLQGSLFGVLPLIGGFAMATIRILPATQMVYHSYAKMQSVHVSVDRAMHILNLPMPDLKKSYETPVPAPKKSIDLHGIWFRFQGNTEKPEPSEWILKGINLSVPVNKTIALVGKTGGGKTTISEIMAGLLHPEKGSFLVDDMSINDQNFIGWRQHVACVPQSIFLMDASVKENIAFGERPEDIDLQKVKNACALAQIDALIEERPKQYDEIIGENGMRLSGGQRQRIGIARALYKDAALIILDEATSALDNNTERTVMETITNLQGQRTLLIIAHRLETIKKADLIYEIQEGQVVAQGTYDELLKNSQSFQQIALAGDKK